MSMIQAVYERYKHLDYLLRDPQWMPATPQGVMLRECWVAICEAVRRAEAQP